MDPLALRFGLSSPSSRPPSFEPFALMPMNDATVRPMKHSTDARLSVLQDAPADWKRDLQAVADAVFSASPAFRDLDGRELGQDDFQLRRAINWNGHILAITKRAAENPLDKLNECFFDIARRVWTWSNKDPTHASVSDVTREVLMLYFSRLCSRQTKRGPKPIPKFTQALRAQKALSVGKPTYANLVSVYVGLIMEQAGHANAHAWVEESIARFEQVPDDVAKLSFYTRQLVLVLRENNIHYTSMDAAASQGLQVSPCAVPVCYSPDLGCDSGRQSIETEMSPIVSPMQSFDTTEHDPDNMVCSQLGFEDIMSATQVNKFGQTGVKVDSPHGLDGFAGSGYSQAGQKLNGLRTANGHVRKRKRPHSVFQSDLQDMRAFRSRVTMCQSCTSALYEPTSVCALCHQPLSPNIEPVYTFPCGHVLHGVCVEERCKNQEPTSRRCCPICMAAVLVCISRDDDAQTR